MRKKFSTITTTRTVTSTTIETSCFGKTLLCAFSRPKPSGSILRTRRGGVSSIHDTSCLVLTSKLCRIPLRASWTVNLLPFKFTPHFLNNHLESSWNSYQTAGRSYIIKMFLKYMVTSSSSLTLTRVYTRWGGGRGALRWARPSIPWAYDADDAMMQKRPFPFHALEARRACASRC